MNESQNITISTVTTEEIPARTNYNRQGGKGHNSKYHVIFNPAIAEPDKWISFPASFVAGNTNTNKQTALHESARLRGIKIKTRIRGEVAYVQYVGPTPPWSEKRSDDGSRGGKYVLILDEAVQHPDKWFRIDPDSVTGSDRKRKQVALHASAARQEIRISTRFHDGFLYLKYAGPVEPKINVPEETSYAAA